MSATLRAAVSLLALVGFYVVTFCLIVGTILGAYLLGEHITMMYWVMVVAAIGGLIVIGTIVSALYARPQVQAGLDITGDDAPELWALVTEIATTAKTPGPTHIRLVADVNASVSEDSRFLGLIGGPRRMYLGVPLLQGLSAGQLRAVLAHEFGHYSGAHTRLGPLAYRGWNAVVGTMQLLQGEDVTWLLRLYGWVLRLPAGTYLLLSLAMRRSQEREADRLMVQFGGKANAETALRQLDVLAVYWHAYMQQFVGMGWAFDLGPTADDFFGGFQQFIDGRADDIAEQRALPPRSEGSLVDTHPPTAERIAAIETMPEPVDSWPADDRPATALLSTFAGLAAATADAAYVFGYRERLNWPDLAARASALDDQTSADVVYGAAARLTGDTPATLATVVGLARAGRTLDLIRSVYGSDVERPREELATAAFATLVRAAAVGSGAARWRLSWSGPFEFVTPDGEPFDADSLGALLADENTAPEAAARLTALGIDLASVGATPTNPGADVGAVVGGISDMKGEGASFDVLVLEHGLLLAEHPGANGSWASLDDLVNHGSVAELAARHRFVPYAAMAAAKVSGPLRLTARVTLNDGVTLVLKEQFSSNRLRENSGDVFKDYLGRVGKR
ncbi:MULTISPECIES: M48 family metallopeptidase [unclassified Mycobacterium]|uniref:M48 family metallopeptidase n=1 Tax=unclassified Mycobacterium TaxID=2642494 RepID=UPI0029C8D417|nr:MULTISPECIES: M48 family metallopeptidase [unclassified Mycobacterium]